VRFRRPLSASPVFVGHSAFLIKLGEGVIFWEVVRLPAKFPWRLPSRSIPEPIGTEQVYRSNVKFIGGNPMAKDDHNKAAEHHDNAAKSHRAAAEQHGKGDHGKGREHSAIAQQHSQSAGKQSEQAHSKSQQQK
jgi:hypothetical protein